jgi:hypothetical protein
LFCLGVLGLLGSLVNTWESGIPGSPEVYPGVLGVPWSPRPTRELWVDLGVLDLGVLQV